MAAYAALRGVNAPPVQAPSSTFGYGLNSELLGRGLKKVFYDEYRHFVSYEKYGMGFRVSRAALENDAYGVYTDVRRALARQAAKTLDTEMRHLRNLRG